MLALRTVVIEMMDVKTKKLAVMIMIHVPMMIVFLLLGVLTPQLNVMTVMLAPRTYAAKLLVANILKSVVMIITIVLTTIVIRPTVVDILV